MDCCTGNQRSGEQGNDFIDARTLNPRPAIHRRDRGLRDRRPETATGQNSMAESGNRPRLVARSPLGKRQVTHRLLGARIRLAPIRARAQSFPPVLDGDRWVGHSLHPRQVEESEGDAPHLNARMARFDRRIPETHWPSERPGGARRERRRLIRRRHPVAARIRVFPKADRDGVDCFTYRNRVGGTHEASWLQELGRTRR
jgi:hypothetical protein